MLLLLCCCYWISFGYMVWMLSKIYGRAEWRAGAWNFRSARMFALYFVLIPMITILFFVAHKACWFFQVLLNYFDTLNISFLFVFFSVVYFIMFQLTITWFCLRYDFMFTKMFFVCFASAYCVTAVTFFRYRCLLYRLSTWCVFLFFRFPTYRRWILQF